MLDEFGDASAELELGVLGLAGLLVGGALIGEGDDEAFVEEGEFAQTIGKGVVVVLGDGEDGAVRDEVNLGAAALGGAGFDQLRSGNALGIFLLPDGAIAADLEIELLGERVDAAHADAVKTAGNLVGRAVELSSGMQYGHYNLSRGKTLAIHVHFIYGNAAAVVNDGDRVVEMNRHVDLAGISSQGFVDRVVNNLIDQMVQAHLTRGADVHSGTLANRFHATENLDRIGGVTGFGCGCGLLVEFFHGGRCLFLDFSCWL